MISIISGVFIITEGKGWKVVDDHWHRPSCHILTTGILHQGSAIPQWTHHEHAYCYTSRGFGCWLTETPFAARTENLCATKRRLSEDPWYRLKTVSQRHPRQGWWTGFRFPAEVDATSHPVKAGPPMASNRHANQWQRLSEIEKNSTLLWMQQATFT